MKIDVSVANYADESKPHILNCLEAYSPSYSGNGTWTLTGE